MPEEANSWVYFLLSTTTRDAPLQILKEVKIGEGRLAIHALANIYASKRPERVSALITELFALQYTTLSNFRQHFNRLNSALKECKCEIPTQVLRHRILTSLPSEYATIVQDQIRLSDKPIPDLFEQLAITDSFNASLSPDHTPTASALAAANQPAKRKRPICTYKPCGKLGHTADKCWLKNPLLKPAKANYTITDSALCTMVDICNKENCPDRTLRELHAHRKMG